MAYLRPDRSHHHNQLTRIAAVAADPQPAVSRLPLLSEEHTRQLLIDWNQTAREYPNDTLIHSLFEAQAARTPEAVALIFEERQLTYRALNRHANRLARHLQTLGVGPETMVGLAMDRSIEQIVALLGILKAGAAYVPLDPRYPVERLALMLAETQSPVVITQPHLCERLPAATPTLMLSDAAVESSAADDENPTSGANAASLAYVIYTSGSTGVPKGVLIDHRGLVNHTFAMVESHRLDTSDRVLQFSGIGFDASAASLFPALIAGASLILPASAPNELVGDQLTMLCERQQITILQLPASIWHQWVDTLWLHRRPLKVPLKVMLVGGESPSVEKLRLWAKLAGRPMSFLNAYGPTEATITTTMFALSCDEATAAATTSIPIGRPLANKQIYILDEQRQLAPIGTAGELYIGGVGLARGYLNRPELNAERFIEWTPPGPTMNGTGPVRLYCTGDRARFRADGQIEFLGRIDHQVKLRGYRIEPGEIEAVLRQHHDVRDAVVVTREDVAGLPRLVAYIVADPAIADYRLDAELSSFLWTKLPAFMIPSQFVPLAALPLNVNGKLDRQALPAPETKLTPHAPGAAPSMPEEIILANIWAQVLGRTLIGVNDDFFTLGGHSLAAARAISLASAVFGRQLPLRLLFEAPTIASFVRAMQEEGHEQNGLSRLNLLAEAALDPTITAPTPWQPSKNPPQTILLTGATGYLGAFLLDELIQHTDAHIYCLVRAEDPDHATARLTQALSRYLLDTSIQNRVTAIPGDLGKPLLGLDQQQFQLLAETIDVIYHAAAQVHYLHSYARLKPTNVQGTVEILRLAATARVKPVHYVSTLSVALEAAHEGVMYEDEPLTRCSSTKGYDQSKWVAESIVTQARARGLPVAIYRPGRIGSHTVSGASNHDDFLVRMIVGCVQLGAAPDIPMAESLFPVDLAARTIVHLSRQPELAHTTFHLQNPQPSSWNWIIETLQAMGHPVRRVAYDEWHRHLLDKVLANPDHILHSLLSYFPQDPAAANWIDVVERYRFDMTNTLGGLAESGIELPVIDRAFLGSMVADLVRQGLINAPIAQAYLVAWNEPALSGY